MEGFRSPLIVLVITFGLAALGSSAALADEPAPGGAPDEPSVRVQLTNPPPSTPESPPASTPTGPAAGPLPAAPSPPRSIAPPPPPPLAPPPTPAASARSSVPPANFSASTPALREARFGEAGQVVLDGALFIDFGHLGYSGGGSNSALNIQPAFDYFVVPGFSLGVSALFRYADNSPTPANSYAVTYDSTYVAYGVTGEVGFNLWLGDRVSFWPNFALGVWRSRTTYSLASAPPGEALLTNMPPVTDDVVFVELFAPFLFHLTQHFFVGFGPESYVDLYNTAASISNRRLFFGASSTVGGWF
jgi:hypothetical protein